MLAARVPVAVLLALASGAALYLSAPDLALWLAQGSAALGVADPDVIASGVRRVLESVRPRKALSAPSPDALSAPSPDALSAPESGPSSSGQGDPSA